LTLGTFILVNRPKHHAEGGNIEEETYGGGDDGDIGEGLELI